MGCINSSPGHVMDSEAIGAIKRERNSNEDIIKSTTKEQSTTNQPNI